MVYLFFAVLCSVSVSILLKILRQKNLDIRQTIAVGYPVAVLLTWFLLKPDVNGVTVSTGSLSIIIALGILLPSVFIMLGNALNSVGIIATDAAQRLSLIIPIVAAFVIFGETLQTNRIVGIILGFFALLALLYKPQQGSLNTANKQSASAIWLLGVWLGYGVIDILFKQVAKQGVNFSFTLLCSFALAGILLLAYLLIQKTKWQSMAAGYGLVLGALNMGNIYAYVKAHQTLSDSPSIVFTGMNIGVISLASVIGLLFFKEKINPINGLGLLLAISCVFVLFLL